MGDHGQEGMQVDLAKKAEPHPKVPSPQDYETVRSFMDANPDIVDLGINMVMDLVGVSCERSTAQAIIDHLQGMLGTADEEVMFPEQEPAELGIKTGMISPEVLGLGGM